MLEAMAPRGASDLHLVVGRPPMLRHAGGLSLIDDAPALTAADTEALFTALVPKDMAGALAARKDLDFAYAVEGLGRFRVNASVQQGTVSLTVRRVHDSPPKFESLGLPEVCRTLAMKKKGLVLVTGPVNSGKSTTMAAMIEMINQTFPRRIVTIEDPVEYVFTEGRSVITQRELGRDVPAFAAGVRSALRQDPDVILVGELRDTETVSACLTAAETGHLVMSTLHTPSAAQAVDRVVDLFPPEQQTLVRARMASLLEAVLYQMLVPTIDGSRRVLALEIMLATPAVRSLIREGKTHQLPNTIHTGGLVGMQTMDQALVKQYKDKVISEPELLVRASNQDEVKRVVGLTL
ncbi:MAG: PilT/PilU family type 4a pilus ATPase [Chloroflexi bacterium]|nr:PilT/PilU family type 4a pilus ATPase [Chloroflexota bacterium]